MPRTTIMHGQGDAPHNHRAWAGGCPAHSTCRGREMPRTTIMQGQGMPRTAIMKGTEDAPHNHHAGAGGGPAQLSCMSRGMPRTTIRNRTEDAPRSPTSADTVPLANHGLYCHMHLLSGPVVNLDVTLTDQWLKARIEAPVRMKLARSQHALWPLQ